MGVWEKRIRGLRRMVSGWQQIAIPDPPLSFSIGKSFHSTLFVYCISHHSDFPTDVIGTNSVLIKIIEPTEGICTKFKGKFYFLSKPQLTELCNGS
jgi:hypothetical protein